MKNLCLTKLKPLKKLSDKKSIGFADTESFGTKSDVFRCGSVSWKFRSEILTQTFFSLKDFCEFLFAKFDIVYFFNLSYDSNFIRNFVFNFKLWKEFTIESGNRLLGLIFNEEEIKAPIIIFKDIFPFILTSLDKASKDFGTLTKKFPEFKGSEKEIEDKWDYFFNNCNDEDLKHHCENDTKILTELAYMIREVNWNKFSIDTFNTRLYSLASLSMKIYRTKFLKYSLENPSYLLKKEKGNKPTIVIRKELEEFCRKAYKGGYCNVENTALFEDIFSFDISSSYPFSISAIRFPVGKARWTTSFPKFVHYAKRIPSICHVKVQFDKPMICGIRDNKLVKLTGIFDETLTSFELFLILRNGGKILYFYKGIVFSEYDKSNSLSAYVRYMYKIKATSKGAIKYVSKIEMNSIYGKVSQSYKRESKQLIYCRTKEEYEYKCNTIKDISNPIQFENGGIIQIKQITEKPQAFMFIVWGALITAFSRCYLLEQAYNCNSVYEDTDSIKIMKEFLSKVMNTIPEKDNYTNEKNKKNLLGFWDLEEEFKQFRSLAPKIYCGITKENEQIVKMKGIPKAERRKLFNEILSGKEEFSTDKYIKLMNPNESLLAKTFLMKSDIFGGIRETQKTLCPKRKIEPIRNEIEIME